MMILAERFHRPVCELADVITIDEVRNWLAFDMLRKDRGDPQITEQQFRAEFG